MSIMDSLDLPKFKTEFSPFFVSLDWYRLKLQKVWSFYCAISQIYPQYMHNLCLPFSLKQESKAWRKKKLNVDVSHDEHMISEVNVFS